MSTDRAEILIQKYLDGNCSPEEKLMLESWYNHLSASMDDLPEEPDYKKLHAQLSKVLPLEPPVVLLWRRLAVAASIIIISSLGYFLYQSNQKQSKTNQQIVNDEIVPGGNKAYLTLANGKKIDLTDAANGEIAKQAGIQITKTTDGQLIYTVSDLKSHTSNLLYNTIETPRGGQYHVVLPDGSKVWLNAASSLKYPASFVAVKERRVELSGEAYFEVAKDRSRPFIVSTSQQEVEVLGTHFNVKAYLDERAVKTTLLEGSVSVSVIPKQHTGAPGEGTTERFSGGQQVILKPDEQAVLTVSSFKKETVDAEAAALWKNGKFSFDREEIGSIMRQISRWYNVEIVYADDVQDVKVSGSVSRFTNISTLLEKLQQTGLVKFKVEANKVVVSI